jgi:CubicO group peptidase (beta-lactamase class C family)
VARRRGPFPLGDPVAEGLDKTKLAALIAEAEAQKSSALLILKNGKLVVERYWGVDWREPLVTMSVSKSIIALAIAQLIAKGRIKSLDQKVGDFIPSWAKAARSTRPAIAQRAQITLRQLLNHTSGLSPRRAHKKRGKLARHALRTRVVTAPGTRFRYNNNAVDMLALVVKAVTARFADDYLQRHLFGPLDVAGAYWMKFQDGHPRLAGELLIRPIDLLKIGKMMLDGGRWGGRQIVPRGWVRKLTAPGQQIYIPCGLLWWRDARFQPRFDAAVLAGWQSGGVAPTTLTAAKPLVGKRFRDRDAFFAALRKAIGRPALKALRKTAKKASLPLYAMQQRGKLKGFSARGWLGQHLLVVPKAKLVALRMRLVVKADYRRWKARNDFPDFRKKVLELAQ